MTFLLLPIHFYFFRFCVLMVQSPAPSAQPHSTQPIEPVLTSSHQSVQPFPIWLSLGYQFYFISFLVSGITPPPSSLVFVPTPLASDSNYTHPTSSPPPPPTVNFLLLLSSQVRSLRIRKRYLFNKYKMYIVAAYKNKRRKWKTEKYNKKIWKKKIKEIKFSQRINRILNKFSRHSYSNDFKYLIVILFLFLLRGVRKGVCLSK